MLASTASPYKFSKSVLEAIADENISAENEFDMVQELNRISGVPIPESLAGLKNKTVRFTNVTEANDMPEYVLKVLGI